MGEGRFVSAREAAAELSIRLPTLYAYVSRGLIRSEHVGGEGRERRYSRDDVLRLKERQEQRRNPGRIAEKALAYGDPVLESSLTLIAGGHLYYRGYDALDLAAHYSIEQVAALLWTGELSSRPDLLSARAGNLKTERYLELAPAPQLSFVESFQAALPLAQALDPAAYDLRREAVIRTGGRIVRLLTVLAARREHPRGVGMARALAESWSPAVDRAAELLNTALVLSADHELNVSAFTARCTASAGSTPYAVVNAGLSALQGIRHGGAVKRVGALFRECDRPARVRRVLAGRLKRGEGIPGFGHPLYPEADPRGRMLVGLLEKALPRNRAVRLARAVVREMEELTGEGPTIDLGLTLLEDALALPEGAAAALFALGRTIGWIGHALEQYESRQLIRPRARYVGPPPKEA